jgi:hypothetical protein
MRTIAVTTTIAFSLIFSSTSEAAKGPGLPIRFGWGSEIKTVGSVDPDSEVGREMGDARVSVALAWNWLWLALPVWCSDREYVLHEDVETLADDTLFWELKDQSKESVARITGVSESDLTFPFYAYLPPGWLAFGALYLVASVISGPSPKKRFARLTSDEAYVESLKMLQPNEPCGDEDLHERDSVDVEEEARLLFATAISFLVSQGISESKAQRNLQFLIGYLNSNPNTTIP